MRGPARLPVSHHGHERDHCGSTSPRNLLHDLLRGGGSAHPDVGRLPETATDDVLTAGADARWPHTTRPAAPRYCASTTRSATSTRARRRPGGPRCPIAVVAARRASRSTWSVVAGRRRAARAPLGLRDASGAATRPPRATGPRGKRSRGDLLGPGGRRPGRPRAPSPGPARRDLARLHADRRGRPSRYDIPASAARAGRAGRGGSFLGKMTDAGSAWRPERSVGSGFGRTLIVEAPLALGVGAVGEAAEAE